MDLSTKRHVDIRKTIPVVPYVSIMVDTNMINMVDTHVHPTPIQNSALRKSRTDVLFSMIEGINER